MFNRREATALFAAALGRASLAPASASTLPATEWPPYRKAIAIDGAGGPPFGFLAPDDPLIPAELDAIRASGLTAVVATIGPQGQFWYEQATRDRIVETAARWRAIIDQHPDDLMMILAGADIDRAKAARTLGVVFTLQGAEPLGEDVGRIADMRALGVRVIQLTHNRRNLVGDGASEPGDAGLSKFGRAVIEALNAERIIVDLAHGARRTIAEGIAAAAAPPLISHTGCRALVDHPRNVDDDALRALAKKGGVAGIIFWPYLTEIEQPMAADVIRHLDHAVRVAGEDHVGLGTDGFVAATPLTADYRRSNREWVADAVAEGVFQKGRPADLFTFIPDLNSPNRFDTLAAMLDRRGWKASRIEKILGGNFARVMREVWG